ncbi:MAG: glycosyltransferase [Pseudomonadota bacterium]
MSRLSEARLLLTRFFERRVRVVRRAGLGAAGRLERVRLDDGRLHVTGTLTVEAVRLRGLAETLTVRPFRGPAEAAPHPVPFETVMLYSPVLSADLPRGEGIRDWRQVCHLRLTGPLVWARALAAGLWRLAGVGLAHAGAIWRYFSRGDLEAAHLLTDVLNPKDYVARPPAVTARVFAAGSAPGAVRPPDPAVTDRASRDRVADGGSPGPHGADGAGARSVEGRAATPSADTRPPSPGADPAHPPEGTAGPEIAVIVPVYNAFALVQDCLSRALAHADLPAHLIVVDDASTDARIRPWLRAFAAEHGPRVTLIEQAENRGFVAAANAGLARAAGRHVVLLNSDALVPQRWLSRLMAPILEDPEGVASVTPLSNDAEIFSAPAICVPAPADPDRAARMDRVAARLAPEVARAEAPTGVGFCMAMGAPWLARLPGFDTAFGRGYGEEVDWCQRAAAMGGRNLGLGTLYVAHASGQSFGAEKSERISAAGARINARYPLYDRLVQAFIRQDPLIGPRLALALAAAPPDRPVPVYLGHIRGGGAEMYLEGRIAHDIAAGGARDGVAAVIRDEPALHGHVLEVHGAEGVTRGLIADRDVLADLLTALPARHLIYSCMVGARDVLGTLGTLLAGQRPGDRFTLLTHDYYTLCPGHTLVDADGVYCDLPAPRACEACYARLPLLTTVRPDSVAGWRRDWAEIYARADEVVAFSEDSAAKLARIYPDLGPRLSVRPHALPFTPPRLDPPPPGAAPVIGVLGAIGRNKGAQVLRDLAGLAGDALRFVVIGTLDAAYAHPAITIHGRYGRTDWPELARDYGVSAWLIPSTGPETFSYTTHEVLATGLPVFAFDLGAQGDAVAQAPNGHLLGPATAPARAVLTRLTGALAP